MCPVYCGAMVIATGKVLAELRGSFSELWSETWPILVATTAMAAIVLLFREFALAGQAEHPIVNLVALSVSGALTYGAALFTFGSPVIGEAAEVAGWVFRRRSTG